jgi:neutral ceramidase
MLGNNTLITGDNKGIAAYLFEKSMRSVETAAPDFVAGFSQSNVGDTSPNVLGAYCEYGEDAGKECRLEDSLCGGKNEPCHGRGPYWGLHDGGTKSCYENGRLQFEGAKAIYIDMVNQPHRNLVRFGSSPIPNIHIRGRSVRSFHSFVDLSHYAFPHPNGSMVTTCPAALGYSFAAGTTDGPGRFDFKQNNSGDPNASPVWKVVQKFIHSPTDVQRACHGAKPILLDVGETKKPYDWSPNIVDVQILRVGQIIIIISPGEASTMAGRRWKEAVYNAAVQTHLLGPPTPAQDEKKSTVQQEPIVLLGGPANTYTHYITTEEEYSIQRYEGASTLYGPHTLNAYINLTLSNLHFMGETKFERPQPSIYPPINTNRSLGFNRPVVVDRAGLFASFGDVLRDVHPRYHQGEIAVCSFVGANPRNNLRLEGTFAAVERLRPEAAKLLEDGVGGEDELKTREEDELTARKVDEWEFVRDDSDWDLVYEWKRTNTMLGTSEVMISWEIGEDVEKGKYRLRYYGDAKALGGDISAFEGTSGVFEIV